MLDVFIRHPDEKPDRRKVIKFSDRADKPIKSILKAFSWRIIGTLDTMLISYFITGKIAVAVTIGSVEVITKTILYYFHERIWAHIHRLRLRLRLNVLTGNVAEELKSDELRSLLGGKAIDETLKSLATLYPGKAVFTTSFGVEDQVITHLICVNDLPIEIATLDTGRLFPETYKVFNETINKYKVPVKIFFPENNAVEEMVSRKGPFSFYHSAENRIECCRIRKVEPLNRALEGKKVWISGIRADQSDNRKKMDWLEYDEDRKILKFYPLFDWSYEQVRDFIKQNEVPYNLLHDRGFVSIGCEPCTRAIKPGEDFRSGRWWWENSDKKECGLHQKEDKR